MPEIVRDVADVVDLSSGDHPLTYVLNEVSDCVLVPRRGASVYRGRVAAGNANRRRPNLAEPQRSQAVSLVLVDEGFEVALPGVLKIDRVVKVRERAARDYFACHRADFTTSMVAGSSSLHRR